VFEGKRGQRMSTCDLTVREAVSLVNKWIWRNGYWTLFDRDLNLLLSENRRSRKSNIIKYGSIPYQKDSKGRVFYRLEDLQDFCESRLKPICKELERQRLEKADKAAEGARLPYAA
jgi:hypothetical protein